MSDPQTKLGQLIEEGMNRDAVHIAVAPVVAACHLSSGDHIGFAKDDGETVVNAASNVTAIGIVDPFLNQPVKKGQRFWMFLYPNTITSLNHVWEHPAFTKTTFPNTFLSKLWMHKYAEQFGFTGERMVRAATDYLDHGNHFCDGDTFESESVPAEFWVHYERITGRVVQDHDDSFFACSC